MTTDKKLEVELLAPEISLAKSEQIEIKIQEEFKPINPQPNMLAVILLILNIIGAVVIFLELGKIQTGRFTTEINWPIAMLCFVSLLASFLVLIVCNQISHMSDRIEQMEKILLEMYQNQKSKG